MINLILQLPATDSPDDVSEVFEAYKVEIPPSGILPASHVAGGKHLVNCVVSGATYQEILDVTTAQRPVWQIFGAQSLLDEYQGDDGEGDPIYGPTIYEPVNTSVWALLNKQSDSNGDMTVDATEIHTFSGSAPWSSRP